MASESQHISNIQQKAIALMNLLQTVRAQSAKGKRFAKLSGKQLNAVIKNLGEARTAEAQHELKRM